MLSACHSIAGKIEPVRSTTVASITPSTAVGAMRNSATWNSPKINPTASARGTGERRRVSPDRSTPRNVISSMTPGSTATKRISSANDMSGGISSLLNAFTISGGTGRNTLTSWTSPTAATSPAGAPISVASQASGCGARSERVSRSGSR